MSSESPQGPGWWQASDGRWYPPADGQPSGAPPATSSQPPAAPPSYGQSPGAPPPPYGRPPGPPPPYGQPPGAAPPGYGRPPGPPPGYGPPPGFGPPPYGPPPSSGLSTTAKVLIGIAIAIVVLGLGSCVAAVVLVGAVADEATEAIEENVNSEEERADIGELDCRADASGQLVADMEVTNNSSERSSYDIQIAFETGVSEIATGQATVSGLAPGASTTATALTGTETPSERFACRLVFVDRRSDET
jgi:hypothetical protein